MRGLTLTQPWATLVALGAKRIETRSWQTKYRGPIAIHAAKGFPDEARAMCYRRPFSTVLADRGIHHPDELPRGMIIAMAVLTDCFRFTGEDADLIRPIEPGQYERQFGDFTPGRYGLALRGVRKLHTPVPCRGMLSLWAVPDALVSLLV